MAKSADDGTQEISEQALKQLQEMYKALFETSSQGIIITDKGTKEIVYVNPALCEMLGYDSDKLTGMAVDNSSPEGKLESLLSEFYRIATKEEQSPESVFYSGKDGEDTQFNIFVNTTLNINGKEYYIGNFTDYGIGRIPICASCKNIADRSIPGKETWVQLEGYLGRIFGMDFTHSICPTCTDKLYPELDDDKQE